MRPRFPLYGKILFWFFLNLLLVAVVLALAFGAQFRLGLDWILAGDTADRIEAVAYLIAADLSERPRPEWNAVAERFSKAYGITFLAFAHDGVQIAGPPTDLPPPVKARVMPHRALRRSPVLPPRKPPLPAAGPLGESSLPGARHPAAGHAHPPLPPAPLHAALVGPRFQKGFIRTSNPTRYWITVALQISSPDVGEPRPVTLLAMSNSLRGGGLLFDAKPWLAAGGAVLLVSALLWFPFVRGITRTIGQMTQATAQIAQGRFGVRVDSTRRDELGTLGLSINQMAERLSGFVSGQKRFLGDIAHELCSPLARLRVALGILEARVGDAERKYLDTASQTAEELAELVNELLSFSKASLAPGKLELKTVCLRDVVQKALGREENAQVPVEVDVPEHVLVRGDAELLVRAVANLLRNAIRYAGTAGPIQVWAGTHGQEVRLIIADQGPGIPEEYLNQVFDPFFRLDSSRDRATGGAGLGLTIVKTCVESCGGQVTCRNREPHGLEVTVQLSMP